MIKKLIALAVAGMFLIIITVVVLVVVFAGQGLSYVAKIIIERGGSYALGVPTTVNVVTVDTNQGSLDLDTLLVANPDGFNTDAFLALNDAAFTVTPETLFNETIEIPTLSLTGIDLALERSPDGANYATILNNLKRFESTDQPAPADASAPTRTFIINEIAIRDVNVNARLLGTGNTAIDDATAVKLNIPEIILQDVGSAADPITMPELASLIVQTLITTSLQVGEGQLPDLISADLQQSLSELIPLSDFGIESLDQLLENPEEAVRSVIDDAAQDLEDTARDALDGLFPRRDNNDDSNQ